jgi:hypothetical protein
MAKKGIVIILAVIALILSGNLVLAQENAADGPSDRALVDAEGVLIKVPGFPTAGTVVSYLVKATNLTVSGRDCCAGGDNWLIKASGILGSGSATTTPEASPPQVDCAALPTSDYSGTLELPNWRIGIVTITSGDIPGGFPANMFLQFSSPGTFTVTQLRGNGACEE